MYFGKAVSYQCIANWFHKRWDFQGNLNNEANLVPLESGTLRTKFVITNLFKSFESTMSTRNSTFLTRNMSGTRTSMPRKKVQKDPLTGKLPCIHVSGDFWESYNIMAVILPSPRKAHPLDYTIGKENGTSEAFVAFLMYLIANHFFLHNTFLMMDYATILMHGTAKVIEDML
jgi:hypothetical protein